MTTTTSIRLDSNLKQQFQILARQMGLSFSSLVSASLRQTLGARRVEIIAPLPEEKMSLKYEKELMNDPDAKETVFVANSPEETREFLTSLMN